MEQQKMVRIWVQVRSGTARFRVGVQAPSIRMALSLLGGRYPQGEVGVAFPIAPGGFFVDEPSGSVRVIGDELIQEAAT